MLNSGQPRTFGCFNKSCFKNSTARGRSSIYGKCRPLPRFFRNRGSTQKNPGQLPTMKPFRHGHRERVPLHGGNRRATRLRLGAGAASGPGAGGCSPPITGKSGGHRGSIPLPVSGAGRHGRTLRGAWMGGALPTITLARANRLWGRRRPERRAGQLAPCPELVATKGPDRLPDAGKSILPGTSNRLRSAFGAPVLAAKAASSDRPLLPDGAARPSVAPRFEGRGYWRGPMWRTGERKRGGALKGGTLRAKPGHSVSLASNGGGGGKIGSYP